MAIDVLHHLDPLVIGGRVQVWTYASGHGVLLLRRVIQSQHQTRVDVAFLNVVHIDIPCVFDGISISEFDSGEELVQRYAQHNQLSTEKKFYGVHAGGYRGMIVAGAVLVAEDKRQYFEDSSIDGLQGEVA